MARRFRPIAAHWAAFLASLLLWVTCLPEAIASSCATAAQNWAAECSSQSGIEAKPIQCALDFATFHIAYEHTSLEVELRADGGPSFKRVGKFGLSPIGEFADWNQTPVAMRTAFDAFAGCVERGLPDSFFAAAALPAKASESSRGRPASFATTSLRIWTALVAMGAVGIAWARRRHRRSVLRATATALGIGLATWGLRRLLLPFAFFHQNGHGPLWVDCALGGHCSYGPGFRELFAPFAVAAHPAAEEGVFLAHSILGATAPVAAWVAARAVSAPHSVALASAFVLAIEPGLGRLAHSESYFGVVAWLFFAAVALLAAAARLAPRSNVAFAAAIIGAGMLIGQAAVVHPVAWVPSTLVPAVVLLGRGSPKRRWKLFGIALGGTGIVAAAASGVLVLRIYEMHQQWGGVFGRVLRAKVGSVVLFGLVVLGLAIATPRLLRRLRGTALSRRRFAKIAVGAVVFAVPLVIADVLHPFRGLTPWLRHAWWVPYLPVSIAAGAALCASMARSRRLAWGLTAIIASCGAIHAASSFRTLTTLPTDTLEAQFVASFRDELPSDARVLHLERANQRLLPLPLYRDANGRTRTHRLVLREDSRPSLPSPLPSHYYRPSLCSSKDARAFCEELESALLLEPVATTVLPALPSMPHLPYDTSEIAVGLYRIVGKAKGKEASAER